MKKIYQNTNTSCLAACIASLFEDESILNDFPKTLSKLQVSSTRKYIRERYGLKVSHVVYDGFIHDDGYLIVSGPTKSTNKNNYWHAVLYKDNKLVHDPLVDSPGLLEVKDALIISTDYTIDKDGTIEYSNYFEY